MKLILISFTIMLHSLNVVSQNLSIRNCKQSNSKSEFKFPIFSLASNSNVAKRINDYLQMTMAEQTTAKCQESDLFKIVNYENQMTGMSTGIVGIDYKIIQNSSNLLSLRLSGETMAAYPDFFETSYNFNVGNGDIILLEDLFTNSGLKSIKDLLKKRRLEKIKKHIYALSQDTEMKQNLEDGADESLLEDFNNCVTSSTFNDFNISVDSIHFLHPLCLPHVSQAMDGDFAISISINEIKSLLNSYGQKLLVQKVAVKAAYHQSIFGRPLNGTIGTIPIVMQLESPSNTINGYYYYPKEGKRINCFGTFDENEILLQCDSEVDSNIHETIEGKIEKNTFKGYWRRSNEKGKSLPILLK